MQEEDERKLKNYDNTICEATKYNKLLFLGDCIISGYLYQKFCRAEKTGVTVIYGIKGCLAKEGIPVYALVEVLGILIDNAVEAQCSITEKRQLIFWFEEQKNQYWFKMLTPHPYAGYDEIEAWFLPESGKKTEGQELGLNYIKKLCAQYDMDLLCKNTIYEKENWIEIAIGIKKADKP